MLTGGSRPIQPMRQRMQRAGRADARKSEQVSNKKEKTKHMIGEKKDIPGGGQKSEQASNKKEKSKHMEGKKKIFQIRGGPSAEQTENC